ITRVFFILRKLAGRKNTLLRFTAIHSTEPADYAKITAKNPNRRSWAPRLGYARPARGLHLTNLQSFCMGSLVIFATLHPHKGSVAQLNG
ncbi:MAG: hypothetical protein MST05_00600, partial [Treponema sp.]|nr:hypothetical protein [Treponema sp.]